MSDNEKTAQEKLLEAFGELLTAKADSYKTTARLWETDPEKFGTDVENIIRWRAIGEGYELALRDFKTLILGKVR